MRPRGIMQGLDNHTCPKCGNIFLWDMSLANPTVCRKCQDDIQVAPGDNRKCMKPVCRKPIAGKKTHFYPLLCQECEDMLLSKKNQSNEIERKNIAKRKKTKKKETNRGRNPSPGQYKRMMEDIVERRKLKELMR